MSRVNAIDLANLHNSIQVFPYKREQTVIQLWVVQPIKNAIILNLRASVVYPLTSKLNIRRYDHDNFVLMFLVFLAYKYSMK